MFDPRKEAERLLDVLESDECRDKLGEIESGEQMTVLMAALSRVRREAIEECAKVCDNMGFNEHSELAIAARITGNKIRALAEAEKSVEGGK